VGFTPQLVDLDSDGRQDVLSGSWPGELYFFPGTEDGSFGKPQQLEYADGGAIDLGSASTVYACDWHSDGDLDLLVGDIRGTVYLVPNYSGGDALAFGESIELLSTSNRKRSDSHPVAADWDGDGRLDLIVGYGKGDVIWYPNINTPVEPVFGEPVELVPPSPAPWKSDDARQPGDWGVRAKICIVDFDGNGKLDILLGDYCGGFSDKPDETPEELSRRREAVARLPELRSSWSDAYQTYRTMLTDTSEQESADSADQLQPILQKMVELKTEIATCQKTLEEFQPQRQAHGYVWLFLRKTANEE